MMLDDVHRILEENDDLADTGHPQTEAAISHAAAELGVNFPATFREYLARWGWISFGPNEYFGLGAVANDVIHRTLQARERARLPSALVVICNHDGDEYVCIDTKDCPDTEGQIVIWDCPNKTISRKRSDSFDKFLLSDLLDFLE